MNWQKNFNLYIYDQCLPLQTLCFYINPTDWEKGLILNTTMYTLQRCKYIWNFCLPAWTLPKIELQTHHETSPKYGHKCSWPAIASLWVTWHGVIKYMFSSFQIGIHKSRCEKFTFQIFHCSLFSSTCPLIQNVTFCQLCFQILLCYSNGNHYDAVYDMKFQKIAAMCQCKWTHKTQKLLSCKYLQ